MSNQNTTLEIPSIDLSNLSQIVNEINERLKDMLVYLKTLLMELSL